MSLFTILISSAFAETTQKLGVFEKLLPPVDISNEGHLIDWLFNYTTALNLFFFTLVCAGLFGFSFLYHKKRHPKAYYTYGNKKPQIMIATLIGVAVFVGIDMNITRMSNNDYIGVFTNWPSEDEDIVRVEVLGQQWAWNFRYPGKDGLFNTDDDVVTLNDLRLPIGKKVVFQVLSKDVIHSLYFPNARRKVDAIPGRLTRLWYQLNKTGEYDIACAEMCGTYHYRMQARLTVYTQEDFDTWLKNAQEHAIQTNDPENPELFWGWQWQ
ncbi:MAG: cytochrome c oxidase subunit II [Bdellovibrio sp.]